MEITYTSNVVQPGVYVATITKALEKTSKNGHPTFECTLTIQTEGPFLGKEMRFQNFYPTVFAPKFFEMLNAMKGTTYTIGDRITVEADDLLHQDVGILVIQKPDSKYTEANEYFPADEYEERKAQWEHAHEAVSAAHPF